MALLDAKVTVPSLVPVADPEAAAACHRAGLDQEVTIALGYRLDPRWGKPVTVTGTVTRLSDGRFRYIGGIWADVEGNMGPSAVLTIGAIQVLVATHGTYDWVDEQFRSMELHPPDAKFIVVKNPVNYCLAYGEIATAAFILRHARRDTSDMPPPSLQTSQAPLFSDRHGDSWADTDHPSIGT